MLLTGRANFARVDLCAELIVEMQPANATGLGVVFQASSSLAVIYCFTIVYPSASPQNMTFA